MTGTLYTDPAIKELLANLLSQMQEILEQKLAGLYLYGSLVSGDFDIQVSDIDLLAVTTADIDGQEFQKLGKMHGDLIVQYPDWDNRIEVQYYSAAALRTFKIQRSQIAVISPGEPFNIKEAGIDWLINWYTVGESGVTIFGPGPQTVIPPISKAEFLQATRDQTHYWLEWTKKPRDRKGQSYAILTMCRALFAAQAGEQASKRQAALWVQELFPQWALLVQNALVWRVAGWVGEVDQESTFPETARFIHYIADLILREQDHARR